MNAHRILLTHFSQRYPKIPTLDFEAVLRTCIVFDLMSVAFSQLPWLPQLLPAFQHVFPSEEDGEVPTEVVVAIATSAP